MPSTYSTSLRIELQADGENASTWGQKANNDFNLFEQAIAGRVVAAVGGAVDVTLTATNGASDQARNMIIEATGVLTGNIALIVPTVPKFGLFYNNTTGAFSLTVKTAAGTGIVVAQGSKRLLYCDGTNVVDALSSYPAASLPVSVANGGTGGSAAGGTLVDNISGFASTGLLARTGAGAYAFRTLTGPAAGIGVSNGDGVAGNPTLALANDLAALEALGSTGFAVRTAADTWAQRTLQNGTGIAAITNPAGIAGDPTIAVDTAAVIMASLLTSNGDIIIRSGGVPARLAVGSSGRVLTVSGGLPSWQTPSSGVTTYDSGAQAIAAGGTITLTHGLGGEPQNVTLVLACTSAELGYNAGDHVVTPSGGDGGRGASAQITATQIIVQISSTGSPITIVRKDTNAVGNITATNWNMIVRAQRFS
jgi:hypothetical protein